MQLLPTPVASEPNATMGTNAEERLASGHQPYLTHAIASLLLPTPRAVGATENGRNQAWGDYAAAIRRWETVTRPAPEPTKLNAKGNPRLSDEFDEWLMGLPAGWITDVPGITWNEVLKACGNGVVIQQATAALRHLFLAVTDRDRGAS